MGPLLLQWPSATSFLYTSTLVCNVCFFGCNRYCRHLHISSTCLCILRLKKCGHFTVKTEIIHILCLLLMLYLNLKYQILVYEVSQNSTSLYFFLFFQSYIIFLETCLELFLFRFLVKYIKLLLLNRHYQSIFTNL